MAHLVHSGATHHLLQVPLLHLIIIVHVLLKSIKVPSRSVHPHISSHSISERHPATSLHNISRVLLVRSRNRCATLSRSHHDLQPQDTRGELRLQSRRTMAYSAVVTIFLPHLRLLHRQFLLAARRRSRSRGESRTQTTVPSRRLCHRNPPAPRQVALVLMEGTLHQKFDLSTSTDQLLLAPPTRSHIRIIQM